MEEKIVEILAARLIAKSTAKEIQRSPVYKEYSRASRKLTSALEKLHNGEHISVGELKSLIGAKKELRLKHLTQNASLINKRKHFNKIKETRLDELTALLEEKVKGEMNKMENEYTVKNCHSMEVANA